MVNLIAMDMSVANFNKYMVKHNLTSTFKEELYLDLWTPNKQGKLSSLLKWLQYKSSFTRDKYTSPSQPYTSTNGGRDLLPVETGPWRNLPRNERICEQCNEDAIVD